MSLYHRLVHRVLHELPAEPSCHPDLAGTQLDRAARARSSTAPPKAQLDSAAREDRPVAMLDDPPLATPAPPVAVDARPLDWSKVMGTRVNALRAHADRVERLRKQRALKTGRPP